MLTGLVLASACAAAPVPHGIEVAERRVVAQPDVASWAKAVRKAGRHVVLASDRQQRKPHCVEVSVYEDAGPYLSRFGTWRACGARVRKLGDD